MGEGKQGGNMGKESGPGKEWEGGGFGSFLGNLHYYIKSWYVAPSCYLQTTTTKEKWHDPRTKLTPSVAFTRRSYTEGSFSLSIS